MITVDVMHGYLHYLEFASIKINTLFCVKVDNEKRRCAYL